MPQLLSGRWLPRPRLPRIRQGLWMLVVEVGVLVMVLMSMAVMAVELMSKLVEEAFQ